MNQHLVQGIKNAMSGGQSLQQAMMSFYNAGYSKKDIEEAAREVQIQQYQAQSQQKPVKQTKSEKPQQVSAYEEKPKGLFRNKLFVIFLAIILIFLLGILAATFFFQKQIVEFFSKLFG